MTLPSVTTFDSSLTTESHRFLPTFRPSKCPSASESHRGYTKASNSLDGRGDGPSNKGDSSSPEAHDHGDIEGGPVNDSRRSIDQLKESVDPSKSCILVSWYSETDPDNPRNWSRPKKGWVSFVILLYTFTVYVGSSLYVASIPGILEVFSVAPVIGSLGLSLYVIGYGLGPMLFSPPPEIPAVGRNVPYIFSFLMFVILGIPTYLVGNMAGLPVLRFLLGFFGSPCLATAEPATETFITRRRCLT